MGRGNGREGGGEEGEGGNKTRVIKRILVYKDQRGRGRGGRWPGGRHRAVGYPRERLADEHDEALGADTKLARPPLEVDDLRTKRECPSSPTEGLISKTRGGALAGWVRCGAR